MELYKQTGIEILESNGNLINHSRSLLTTIPYLRLIKGNYQTLLHIHNLYLKTKKAIIYLIWNLELEDLLKIQNNALRVIEIDDNNVPD